MYRSEKSSIKSTTKDGDLVLLNGRVIPKACIIRNSNMDDFFIAKEKMGLLGLTSREDKVTPPVTKKDVCDYIMVNVNQVRTEMEAKLKSDEKQKLPGLFKQQKKNGEIHIEVDGKPMDIPWKQPEQMVHLIFNDAKIADNFIKTLRIILADDRQLARLSNEKLLIQNYHAEGLPNHAVAVRLTYTQFRNLQDKLAPLPAAPGGPKTK
jgi:signal recognition particle subunit SEC65